MPPDRRNAIVTGAASGLGRAIALRLARDGWRIALVDVNDAANAETQRLVEGAGGEGRTHHMDVSRPEAWQALHDKLRAQWPRLDLLVNNAGVAGSGEVGKFQLDDWHWILGINLNAGIYGCHFCVDWLKVNPHGAHIINTASMAAIGSKAGMAGYNVTKAGMLSLSETLYAELKPHGVGVTVLCPYFFQTNLLSSGKVDPTDKDEAAKMMRAARFTADEVAEAAIRAMYRKQLYVVMPSVARRIWRLKRLFPTYVCNVMAKDWGKRVAAQK